MYGYWNQPKRNQPVDVEPVNPKPESPKTADTGNAGLDGYTVLARADRETGLRPMVGGTPSMQGPRYTQEQ